MKKVAVTGGYASGKTFVLEIVKSLGYKVFFADEYVKNLYKDPNIQKCVLEILPELKVFDKKIIANIIYHDDTSRQKLENFIHPLVKQGIDLFSESNKDEKITFFEIPLLFEAGFDKYFDFTLCVYCNEETSKTRAKNRKTFSQEIFDKIQDIQLPTKVKIEKSDFTINSELANSKIISEINKIAKAINE